VSVKTQVIEIVAEQLCEGIENPDIGPGSSFLDDLKADSLDLVELVMAFEDKFGITVPDEDYEKIATVGDAINYINALLGNEPETGAAEGQAPDGQAADGQAPDGQAPEGEAVEEEKAGG